MEIALDTEQVQLLVAVEQKRVHMDPRFRAPDFERDPGPPLAMKRATQRMVPLKRMRLVELEPADKSGVRLYKLTTLGEQVLAEVREQEAAARTEVGA
ncbi:hypothetical protein [Micromonospora fulviviridis]|uniref:hypothetical protein n=1 Tax=Micromonospora fulviviridis TaxID=47860 RepID=UPI0037BB2B3D